jgi:hypothetical protein
MSTFAIVDLSNLFQIARHAANTDPETKVGMAILIVFRSLRKMYRESEIDHFVFAVDHGSWRYQAYPAYKSRRKLARLSASPADQEENTLFTDALTQLVTYFNESTRCTVLEAEGIEGDDFIARWIARHPQDDHIIISGDSDFVQLISPNVCIYDAINQRNILRDGITNDRGRLAFSVSPKDGKIKVGKTDPNFIPELEWWRKALFIKLIRGDTGDSVFSAYPGVRYEGKKCSIRAAWDDRKEQGYDWNNLMFQTWNKLLGSDEVGNPLTETVRVIDEYKINQSLIDLTMQPPDVVATMDRVIDAAITQPLPVAVGIHFLRLCATHDQPALAKEANDHVNYLNASYPKDHCNVVNY